MAKYKPGYDEEAIRKAGTQVNISGRSPQDNLSIEEANQRRVAESPKWMLARKLNARATSGPDSKAFLENLGFKVKETSDDLFYEVEAPAGWTKETSGFWTTVRDASGAEAFTMFYKGAWYDRDAFISAR